MTRNTGTEWFLGRLFVYALCDLTRYRSAIDSLAHIHSLIVLWFPGLREHNPSNSYPYSTLNMYCKYNCFAQWWDVSSVYNLHLLVRNYLQRSFLFSTWFCGNRRRMTEQQYAFPACTAHI